MISPALHYISNISEYVPKIRLASKDEMVERVKMLAVPVIAIVAASMAREVEAIGFAECIDNCNSHQSFLPAKLICYTLCHFFSKN